MSRLIKGLHHASMKCRDSEQYAEAKRFYGDILGLDLLREWPTGCMFDTGAGIIEIFNQDTPPLPQGTVRHFALSTDDVDACVEAVKQAGYKITVPPSDVTLPADPPFPIRMAFCNGPLGEEIEFFTEK